MAAMLNLRPIHELTKWRDDNSVTQRQLALMVGTTAATVSRWETGTTKPRMRFVWRLRNVTRLPARVFRPDLAEVMEMDEKHESAPGSGFSHT